MVCNSLAKGQQKVALEFVTNPTDKFYGHLIVKGLDRFTLSQINEADLDEDGWKGVFSVYFGDKIPSSEDFPSMLGKYLVEEDLIVFRPRFPFTEGASYVARFNLPMLYSITGEAPALLQSEAFLNIKFDVPEVSHIPATKVEAVYPSTGELPMNQLKLYIYFSNPIRIGQVYDHIRIIDQENQEVAVPFLKIKQELWDREQKRLTIWFDPGRIKRDLSPNEQLGLPLQEGNDYRLEINTDIKDVYGRAIVEPFTKPFTVIASDRKTPSPNDWRIETPQSGTSAPMQIRFPESMDHALLSRSIIILDQKDNKVDGEVTLKRDETIWKFTPSSAWKRGKYQLQISTRLEDLAGNNLNRLFDTDLTKQASPTTEKKFITLAFEIK